MTQPNYYNLCIASKYENADLIKNRYTRVGIMFKNQTRNTGEEFYTIKLDFPVGGGFCRPH